MQNLNEIFEEGVVEKIITTELKSLLYDLNADGLYTFFDNGDELEEACRVLIEFFGTPKEDYTFD